MNTATATLNGIGFSATADVTFGDPTNEFDECVDVDDTNVGFLGTVCADDAPATFQYYLDFGRHPDADVYLECDYNEHENVASFTTNDTATTGSDSAIVDVTVFCETACTLTPGYWKTHSAYHNNGKHRNDTWDGIMPDAEDTIFFLSGMTYYNVLGTSPGGNVYYNLSFNYIAALLNQLNGATPLPAEVQTVYNAATTFFSTFTPAQIAALRGNHPTRAAAIANAGILGAFNEGEYPGFPHCDEFNGSVETGVVISSVDSGDDARRGQQVEADSPDRSAAQQEAAMPVSETIALPTEFALAAAYPNPLSARTTLQVHLPEAGRVTVVVYDVLGRQVATLMDDQLEAGSHRVVWDASSASSGLYVVVMRAGSFTASHILSVVR